MPTEKIKVTPELTFIRPDGQTLHATDIRLELTRDDDAKLTEYRIVFMLSQDQYEAVSEAELFNLEHKMRGDIFAGGFEPGPIEIEARLDHELLSFVSMISADVYDAGALLIDEDGAELRKTERWFALFVKQQRGHGVKTGYRTLWR